MLGVREGVPVYLERSGNVSDKVNSEQRQETLIRLGHFFYFYSSKNLKCWKGLENV